MLKNNSLTTSISTNNLPTLPHILLKLLDACNRDNIDFDEVAAIVSTDPALSAMLLKLVNSAYFGLPRKIQDVSQAVVYVGASGMKNMALCSCLVEAFPKPEKNGQFNLKLFWWHSLRCAFLAKLLAEKLEFDASDNAFMSGLLHDIGKIVLWNHLGSPYAEVFERYKEDESCLLREEERLGATHSDVGAWLLRRWKFPDDISDPVRYHHETEERIDQALPLVQIVYIANRLCRDETQIRDSGVRVAKRLFGLSEKECIAVKSNADEEARETAGALGIEIVSGDADHCAGKKDQHTQNDLIRNTRNMAMLMGTLEGFLTARGRSDILSVISDGLGILMEHFRPLFFLLDKGHRVLNGYLRTKSGQFERVQNLSVSMRLNQCLPIKAILENKPVSSVDGGPNGSLTILDEQIVRLAGGEGIFCHPLAVNEEPVGVLVLPINNADLPRLSKNKKLLAVFLHKGALALQLDQLKRSQLQEIQTTRVDATSDLARKVVHEVNNPLSIIKNYLKILEMKWPEEEGAIDEIRIIGEEITRVSELLSRLTDFSEGSRTRGEKTDINLLLTDLVKLTREPLFKHSKLKIETDFQPQLPMVHADKAGLKQVFINLIKNAAEAMTSGGTLLIQTRHVAPPIGADRAHGKGESGGCVNIQFVDDGPGIPEPIKEKLFDPYVSTKKDGHSGLGLSIAYNIVHSFHGKLSCEDATGNGTVFTVELPLDENETAVKAR
jgi:putative nucleotidyltransferase with HDIG domain